MGFLDTLVASLAFMAGTFLLGRQLRAGMRECLTSPNAGRDFMAAGLRGHRPLAVFRYETAVRARRQKRASRSATKLWSIFQTLFTAGTANASASRG